MITENVDSLKINKLTQEQYDTALSAGILDENALYLTPFEDAIPKKVSDLENDAGYTTAEELRENFEEAKSYADTAATTVKDDLLNGAGDAYDTLKELGDLIDENVDAIEALELVAIGKADADHTHDMSDIASGVLPVANGGTGASDAATARTNLGITPANIGAATADHTHDSIDVTSLSGVWVAGTGTVNSASKITLKPPSGTTVSDWSWVKFTCSPYNSAGTRYSYVSTPVNIDWLSGDYGEWMFAQYTYKSSSANIIYGYCTTATVASSSITLTMSSYSSAGINGFNTSEKVLVEFMK